MREGKISQAVLDRSVLRVIKNKNSIVAAGGAIGRDSSILKIDNKSYGAVDTRTVCVDSMQQIQSAFVHIVNHIACGGSVAEAVIVSIVLPQTAEEKLLKLIMETIEEHCCIYNMQIMGGRTVVNDSVPFPVVTMTGIGTESYLKSLPMAKANQDILITKWIALEGTAYAALKYREKISKRLPEYLIKEAENFYSLIDSSKEAVCAYKNGASAVHDAGEGGVFAALWEFAKASNVGVEVNLKKIPIRQETVEICELLKINPYELLSTGSLIIAVDNGGELCEKFLERGIPAQLVGRTTASNDRVLLNEEEVRHLTPAGQDSIYQI